MSLPEFSEDLTREDVINQILYSIAMEEMGLSHIINAEGEKLQYAIGTLEGVQPPEPPTVDDLIRLNDSIRSTLDSAAQTQIFLKVKMEKALDASSNSSQCLCTFKSSYAEGLGNGQTVNTNENIVFDVDSIDVVGNNITLDSSGTVFTINEPGLYHIEWNINLAADTTTAIVGILENGEAASGSTSSTGGNFASGTLINVDTVPFTISLHNYGDNITLENPVSWENTAASIRIVRFADEPSA